MSANATPAPAPFAAPRLAPTLERLTATGRRFATRRGYPWTVPARATFERRVSQGLARVDWQAERQTRGAYRLARALIRTAQATALAAVRDCAVAAAMGDGEAAP